MFKTTAIKTEDTSFGHLNFEDLKIVSNFDIRISNLSAKHSSVCPSLEEHGHNLRLTLR